MAILDFSKAFDKVPHIKLLYKLKHYGIKVNTLQWKGNFLKQRGQWIVAIYSLTHVDTGVQHGTILWPLLCILYINDISK